MEGKMAPEIRSYPVVDAVIGIFSEWLTRRRESAETCGCDAQEFALIARDLGVSVDELDDLVRRSPYAADELPKMLAALHLDAEAIARAQPLVMRDMERVCAHCEHKRQCDHDLAVGAAAQHYTEYCGNTPNLEALGAKVKR
jgi:hypothetical protein